MNKLAARRLLFRADGNAAIGLGHVMRLIAVAESLRGLAPGVFLVQTPTAAVTQLVAAAGWEVVALTHTPSLLAEAVWLTSSFLTPHDVIVLDGYDFGLAYQRQLQDSGCGLVFIDDLCAWPVVADVLINHSPGIAATDYQALTTTRFLLGPAFSLLRPPFLAAAALPPLPTHVASALVCFGGADPLGLTIRTLKTLLRLPQLERLGVVVGSAFGASKALQGLVNHNLERQVIVYQNVEAASFVHLLQDYALAVVPASTVLIEALVLGRPAITGYYADNQRALAAYVHAHRQAFSVGDFSALTDAELATSLQQGVQSMETFARQPYAGQLQPEVLRAAIQRVLDR